MTNLPESQAQIWVNGERVWSGVWWRAHNQARDQIFKNCEKGGKIEIIVIPEELVPFDNPHNDHEAHQRPNGKPL